MYKPASSQSMVTKFLQSETALVIAFSISLWAISLFIRYTAIPEWKGFTVLLGGFPPLALLWAICHQLRRKSLAMIIALGPVVSILAELFHLEILSILDTGRCSWQNPEFSLPNYLFSLYLWSLFYFTWYLGYFAIINYTRFARKAMAAQKARSDADSALLEMLHYQINPHFLFNALNSISALVLDKENQKAEKMVGSLSRFLRFSLGKSSDVQIRLEEEIDIIREYLEIEGIRFSEKLDVIYDIREETKSCLVPSLILQPAIENAIKHAITPKKSGGIISISSEIIDGKLVLSVADNGEGFQDGPSQIGVGIKNMQERLRVLYGDAAELTLANSENGGVLATITLPATFFEP